MKYSFIKRAISFILSFALCVSMTTLTGFAAGEGEILYEQYFDTMADLSEDSLFTLTQNSDESAYADIDNGALAFGKTTKGVSRLKLNFGSELGDNKDYLLSMDLSAAVSMQHTVNISLGGVIAIRSAGDGLYTVEWHDNSAWNKDDTTTYNLVDGAKFRFVVKNQNAVDVYIGNKLVQADIPSRKNTPFTALTFEMGNSAIGSITLDNIVVTTDTTIEQLPEPEPEPEPEPDIGNGVTTSDTPIVGAPDVAKEDFDLYLAIGQSNMAGRAPVEEQDRISIPNAYLLNGEDEWESAQAQYVDDKWCGFNRYSTVRKTGATQGINPAFYFAKTVSESIGGENKKIGIINNARGDTSIEAWQKGYTHSSKDFDLYEEAVRRAKTAMEKGTLRGIIWHQGCANITSDASSYIQKFVALAENLRSDLGIENLPIIIGEIPGFGDTETKIANRMNFNKNCIAKIPAAVDNCWYVSSAGSRDIGDKTHFDTASQRRLGTLYAEVALNKIYGFSEESLNTVPLTANIADNNAAAATDGVADIHSWGDDISYWGGIAGSVWTADFAQQVNVEKIKAYFRNPYNYVAQYKIYLGNEGSWTLVSDNSGITDYPYIDKNGAVIDDVENIVADSIKVEITGGVDIDGLDFEDVIGCHEFEVLTSDDISATVVSFDGYAGSADISVADADTITVNASSPDGIKNVKIYFDGELTYTLTEAPYEIDISGLGVSTTEIRAVAESNSGKIAEAVLNLNITSNFLAATFEDSDFVLDSATMTKSGIVMNSQRGYVKVDTIDAEHGSSILVGMDTVDDSFSTGSLPFISIPVGGITDNFTFMCDVYISAKDNSGDKKITLYEKSGMDLVLAQFKSNGTTGSVAFDYDEEKWYTIRFDIDVAKRTFITYIDGKKIAEGATLKEGLTKANYIRLYGQRYDDIKAFTAIDNIRVMRDFEYVSVVSVGNNGVVSPEAKSFEVFVDKGLKKESITTDNISLADMDGINVALSSVVWDGDFNKITVTPAKQLSPNSKYTLIIGENVRLSVGVKLGIPLKVSFATEMRGVDITDVDFDYTSGTHTADVTLCNATDKETTVYVVMTLWNGKVFGGMKIVKTTIAPSQQPTVDLSIHGGADAVAQVYTYGSLKTPVFSSGHIYTNK